MIRHWPKFVVFGLLAAATAALFVRWYRVNERAQQSRDISNGMHQIGIGLHNYFDVYQTFPPTTHRDTNGRALGSWRMAIEPFMGMGYLMPQAERWDDPENRWTLMKPHYAYCYRDDLPDRRRLHTNIVAITGKGTFFDVGKFVPNMRTSNLIVAIEVAESGYHWMEPGDISIDQVTPEILKGIQGDGLHVLCADVSVHFISADAPLEDVKKFFTVEGSEKHELEVVLGRYIR